ncbi:MAG: hypothetical protein KGH71_02640 [Candidatus Micrarchaeota archaeon]|nr:hypothetical protein [Candidatus Micrarchaeota archaeon]
MQKYPVVVTIRSEGPTANEVERVKKALLKEGFKDVKQTPTLRHDLEGTISGKKEMDILKTVQKFSENHKKDVLSIEILVGELRLSPH